MAPAVPAMMDELLEEILIHLPPTEPENLLRAASSPAPASAAGSVSSTARPPCSASYATASTRIATLTGACLASATAASSSAAWPCHLVVWDPVMDEWSLLPTGPQLDLDWNAAVLCPACGTDACDPLDCHRGPFLVVYVGTGDMHMKLLVYSSEAGAWSEPTYLTQIPKYYIDKLPSAIVGNAVHFVIDHSRRILRYNLATREISVILQPPESYWKYTAIMTMEDGGLGIARIEKTKLLLWSREARLSLWSMEASPDGSVVWTQIKVIDLEKLLSIEACSICPDFLGFAHGIGLLYVGTDYGLFSYDLKSGQVRKACEGPCHFNGIRGVHPYMSFYTPALGAVSTGD